MSNTSALVPYLFEGHRIRVSTDQQGEAWIVVADACAALAESPMVWAMANRRRGGALPPFRGGSRRRWFHPGADQ